MLDLIFAGNCEFASYDLRSAIEGGDTGGPCLIGVGTPVTCVTLSPFTAQERLSTTFS